MNYRIDGRAKLLSCPPFASSLKWASKTEPVKGPELLGTGSWAYRSLGSSVLGVRGMEGQHAM